MQIYSENGNKIEGVMISSELKEREGGGVIL